MASQEEKSNVIKTVRACILSCKGGVQINALDRDYKSLVGSHIPYKSMGYSSLEEFIRDSPDLYCSRGPRGDTMVHAEANESSAHITDMINRQKSSSKKRAPPPNWAAKGARYKSSHWKPPPKYNPPRFNTPAKPSASNSSILNSKSPLSVTIGMQDYSSRKVIVEKKSNNEESHIYELPPRFQRTESTLKMGPRFNSQKTDGGDLREKLNEMKARKPRFSGENGVTSKTNAQQDDNISSTDSNKSVKLPSTTMNDEKQEDSNKVAVVPRWLRTTSQADSESYNSSYTVKLENYLKARNWPDPSYKILTRQPKGEGILYGSQVKIGNDHNFASYPDEAHNIEDAKELAAKKAYKMLIESDQTIFDEKEVTDDLSIINPRVLQIVEQFPGGVWSDEVMKIYTEQHNEILPENWLSLASSCESLYLTSTVPDRVILYPDKGQRSEEIRRQEEKLRECTINSSPIPIFEDYENVPISEKILPSVDCWDVFISDLVSSNTVYLRLIGEEYSDKYDNLMSEIEVFYSRGCGDLCPKENIKPDSHYIGRLENNWYRVCALEELEDGENYNCHLIDNGDYEIFNKSELFRIERQFCLLQPQAILCSLAGIDDIEDPVLCKKIFELLVGNIYVATINTRDEEKKEYSLTLHDTSVDPNINLNETILNLMDSMYRPSDLLKVDSLMKNVCVSHIREDGNLYVQIESARFDELIRLTENLDQELILKHRIVSCWNLKQDKKYLAKFSQDDAYYRAILTGPPTPNVKQVELLFIDFGNVEKVNLYDISDLETLSPALYKIHPQAVLVSLHGLKNMKIGKSGYEKLKELIFDDDDSTAIKVWKNDGDGSVPEVEVFKTLIQPDGSNKLISINSTIAHVLEQSRNSQTRKHIRRTESWKDQQKPTVQLRHPHADSTPNLKIPATVYKKLLPPPVPDIEREFFDVYVTMAAHPSNFIVQPLNTLKDLGKMTAEMVAFYDQHDEEYAVDPDDLFEGGLYAAIVNEEVERVTISSVMDRTQVSVHACDTGEYKLIEVNKLRYLNEKFTELPYQAIRAKLDGARPIHGDWSTSDCIYFQNLTVGKSLVSIVKEKGPDLLRQDAVLSLHLVDTNEDEDIIIIEDLIKKRRAVAIDKVDRN